MKHALVALAAAIGAVGVLPVVHATDNYAFYSANNVVGLSLGSQHQNYSEFINGATADGNYGDVKPSYRLYATTQRDWRNISDLYFAVSASYASGSTTYDGALVNLITGAQTPVTQRTPTRLFDWNIRGGKAFTLNEDETVQLIPYLDYAQHHWDRLDGGGEGDYSEYYKHSVISAGVIGQYAVTDVLVLSAEAQLGYLYNASVHAPALEGLIDLGNGEYINGTNGPIILGNHDTVMLSLGVDYALTYNFHVTADYRWQRYGYGMGVNNDFSEPNSTSIMQRVEVGIALTF